MDLEAHPWPRQTSMGEPFPKLANIILAVNYFRKYRILNRFLIRLFKCSEEKVSC